ncbi:MAG: hypothetical protein J6I56_08440 [Lachnospiraceae bacterium]|nr:hypothetical protein [Lachnospiraceae bacterium]
MNGHKTDNRMKHYAAAGLLMLLLAFVLALRFDYYFDLNDDVLMKDILAGVYTGVPESRNIQMLFPVSAFVSLLYRIFRSFDWYGFFLLTCQFGSMALILGRALCIAKTRTGRILACAGTLLCGAALLLPHLMYVQYTITCAMLCAAAAFDFATMDLDAGEEGFRYSDIAVRVRFPGLLLWIAFFIRSEMTLLLLPLVMTGLLLRLLFIRREETGDDQGETAAFARIFTLRSAGIAAAAFVFVGAGIAFGLGADHLATRDLEWRAFRSFFDARTELYDFYFYDMPDYEDDPGFYERAGVDEAGAMLLKNYNFSLDETIDETKLWALVDEARAVHAAKSSPAERLREAATGYIYRIRHLTDAPYSLLVLIGYLLVFAQIVKAQERQTTIRGLFAACFLFFVRTGLWGFILYRGRDPERIIHSLFLLEFVLLAALLYLLQAGARKDGDEREEASPAAPALKNLLFFALWFAAAAAVIPGQLRRCDAEGERRERVNTAQEAYLSYCDEHPEEVFFTDVYSTVRYSQKMFDRRGMNGSFSNQDLMGGWAAKSPLYEKRLAALGLSDMQTALAENDRVRFVSAPSRSADWLVSYYAARGYAVELEQTETIGDDWIVYSVKRK